VQKTQQPVPLLPLDTAEVDAGDTAYLAQAEALIAHLEEMGDNASTVTVEQYVEGLRAQLDSLLDAGADLAAFAEELDLDIDAPDLDVDYAEVDTSMYAGGTDGAR
jgi:hypothetical protein